MLVCFFLTASNSFQNSRRVHLTDHELTGASAILTSGSIGSPRPAYQSNNSILEKWLKAGIAKPIQFGTSKA